MSNKIIPNSDYTYPYYLDISEKHLSVCKKMQNDLQLGSPNVLLEIYYLSGYILESIFVYAIYKHWKWPSNKSIKVFDSQFSYKTGVCFFKRDKDGNPQIVKYAIESHGFQDYVDCLRTDFSSSNIPYINDSCIDSTSKYLIDNWSSDIRYLSYTKAEQLNINLTEENIKELMNTCSKIVKSIKREI